MFPLCVGIGQVRSMTNALFEAPSILKINAPEVGCRCEGFFVRSAVAEIEDLGGVVFCCMS